MPNEGEIRSSMELHCPIPTRVCTVDYTLQVPSPAYPAFSKSLKNRFLGILCCFLPIYQKSRRIVFGWGFHRGPYLAGDKSPVVQTLISTISSYHMIPLRELLNYGSLDMEAPFGKIGIYLRQITWDLKGVPKE